MTSLSVLAALLDERLKKAEKKTPLFVQDEMAAIADIDALAPDASCLNDDEHEALTQVFALSRMMRTFGVSKPSARPLRRAITRALAALRKNGGPRVNLS